MATSILLVALFIGVLITFHEFGHLIAAKLSRIPVESFSIGFGPVLLKKKIGETEYRLSLVPLGGYIKMVGEEKPEDNGFSAKPLGTRIAVVAAGPASNLVLGFLILVIMFLIFGVKFLAPVVEPLPDSNAQIAGLLPRDIIVKAAGETIPDFGTFTKVAQLNIGKEIPLIVLREGKLITLTYQVPTESLDVKPLLLPIIDRVRSNSPAAKLGLKPGDKIVAVAGVEVKEWEDFVNVVMENGGVKIPITYQRGETLFYDSITPSLQKDAISNERFGQIGVWLQLPRRSLNLYQAFFEATRRTVYITGQTFVIIYKVITRKISTRAIGGPIMVAKIAYEGASWGAEYFLALWALLSINLFVVNMLPIPVLDGGRILLDLIGGVRRRRLSEKEYAWASNIGWVLIGILIIFTIFNDIIRLIQK